MKRTLLLCGLALLAGILCAQTPAWEWAVSGGGANNDYGWDICADNSGNSYSTGAFQGVAIFGAFSLTSAGTQDVFVTKTDPSGNYVWAVRAGGVNGDQGMAIARDNGGNLFVSGYFAGTATFGAYSVTSVGQFDMFVAKLDANGNWLWARSGGSAYYDHSYGVSTDAAGNCYATGYFNGNATFGPFTLSGPAFWGTIWVAKFDPDGNWLWAVSGGGPDDDASESIATDSAGYSCITGSFEGTSTFGAHSVTSFGNSDILVAKLDPDGNWLWARHAGGLFPEYGNGVALDASGKCFITGSFSSENATFGTQVIHSDGWDYEIFAACLDADGNWLWATGTEPTDIDNDSGQDIIPDGSGNCFITGYFESSAVFGSTTLNSVGATDIYVAKLDSEGNWLWVMQAGSTNSNYGDSGAAIAVSPGTHVLVAGACSYLCMFGDITLTNTPMYANAYVASIYDEAQNPPPGQVTLLSPADGAMNLPLDGFDLQWEPDPNGGVPDYYTVYLANDIDQIYNQQAWTCWDTHFNPVAEGMGFFEDETWYWTIKAINGGGEAAPPSPRAFTTWSQWVISSFPNGWDFEGASFPPDGWTTVDLDGEWSSWQMYDIDNHTPGGFQSAVHWRNESIQQSGWLITPPVAVPAGQYTTLSFWSNNAWEDYYRYQGVMVNTVNDPNAPGWTELWSPERIGQIWLQQFVDLSAYGGQVVYFAFLYAGQDGQEWIIDDVSIYQVQPITEFPAFWDFEDGNFPPVGWTSADLDGKQTTWEQLSPYNHTPEGTYSAVHFYSTLWEPAPGQDGWLITPPVSIPAEGTWGLDFWQSIGWLGWYQYNGVWVNTVNDPEDAGWTELWWGSYTYEDWQETVINLNAYRGQTIYLAFVYQGYDAHDWHLDDISIHELGADILPPIISYLKPLNSPRDDIPFRLTASVVDDPTFQSPIGGMNLHCSYFGSEGWVTLPMALLSGTTWYADIPPQPLNVEVDYYFEAWDIYNNYTDTQPYKWFYVENPAWLAYDDGGTNHLDLGDTYISAATVYANPFYDLGLPVKVLQTGCGSNVDATAILHIYAWDGSTMADAMPPLDVTLNQGELITYQDLTALNVLIDTPYFIVDYDNIPPNTGIWFDNRFDYDSCHLMVDGVLNPLPVTGSWVMPALVTNGSGGLTPPQITITPVDWYWMISWEPVSGAAGYKFYGTNNPYDEESWTLLQTTPDTWVFYQEPEPYQFFRVTSLSELPPAKALLIPYPLEPDPRFTQRRPALRQLP